MKFKRGLGFVVAASFACSVFVAAPAAAEASGGDFECTGTFPVWPSTGDNFSGVDCSGVARGVFREGSTVLVCAPYCDFSMRIDRYSTTCASLVPPLMSLDGLIVIRNDSSSFDTPFQALTVGGDMTLTTSSPQGAGKAAFLPVPPIPTCQAPGELDFELNGSLVFD